MTEVYVRTLRDVVDSVTGQVIVPADRRGLVIDSRRDADTLLFHCEFKTNTVLIQRWLTSTDLAFADGSIGPVRAYLAYNATVVTDIKFPKFWSPTDPLVGDGLTYQEDIIDLYLDSGIILRFLADYSYGKIVVEVRRADATC